MKALEDEWYIVIKGYKFTIFWEIFVLPYTVCPTMPTYRVYWLYSPVYTHKTGLL